MSSFPPKTVLHFGRFSGKDRTDGKAGDRERRRTGGGEEGLLIVCCGFRSETHNISSAFLDFRSRGVVVWACKMEEGEGEWWQCGGVCGGVGGLRDLIPRWKLAVRLSHSPTHDCSSALHAPPC